MLLTFCIRGLEACTEKLNGKFDYNASTITVMGQ